MPPPPPRRLSLVSCLDRGLPHMPSSGLDMATEVGQELSGVHQRTGRTAQCQGVSTCPTEVSCPTHPNLSKLPALFGQVPVLIMYMPQACHHCYELAEFNLERDKKLSPLILPQPPPQEKKPPFFSNSWPARFITLPATLVMQSFQQECEFSLAPSTTPTQ